MQCSKQFTFVRYKTTISRVHYIISVTKQHGRRMQVHPSRTDLTDMYKAKNSIKEGQKNEKDRETGASAQRIHQRQPVQTFASATLFECRLLGSAMITTACRVRVAQVTHHNFKLTYKDDKESNHTSTSPVIIAMKNSTSTHRDHVCHRWTLLSVILS
jgi:hypothetical protein